jgi:hypothetical protein
MTEEPIPVSKNCGKCKETKLLSEFNLLHGSSDRKVQLQIKIMNLMGHVVQNIFK